MDRRRAPRLPTSGRAVLVLKKGAGHAKLMGVRLLDSSPYGLGVACSTEIKPGASFLLYPEHGQLPMRSGRVARCVRTQGGYRIGLQTTAILAAA